METSDSERESSRAFVPFWVIYLTRMSGQLPILPSMVAFRSNLRDGFSQPYTGWFATASLCSYSRAPPRHAECASETIQGYEAA